ncbi:MAG: MFS transporter [Bryobacteraceae bacterium]|nr:MFS transporter [Bryobacteraceae bacterium]
MNKRAVSTVTVSHLFLDISQGAVPALVPFFVSERHYTYAAAASLVFAANVVSSVIQPWFGHMADRRNSPWLLPAGLLVAGLGLALAGFAGSYPLALAAMMLAGCGMAAYHPEAARLVMLSSGDRHATGMSVFAVGGNAGFALGPFLATQAMVAYGLGGVAWLLAPAVLMATWLLSQLGYLERVARERQATRKAALRGVDRWSAFWRLSGCVAARSMVSFGIYTFLPIFWIEVLHQTKSAGGTALSILLAAGAFGTLLGGQMADRWSRKRVIIIAFSLLGPTLWLLQQVRDVTLATWLLIPLGIALFIHFSVMVVLGQEYLPNRVGTASGITIGLATTVGGVASPLLGWLADHTSVERMFLVVAAIPLFGLAMALTLPDGRPLRRTEEIEQMA